MDISVFVELITNLGFPIAIVIALGFFVFKIYSDSTAAGKAREDKLYEEIGKNQAINEKALSTLALYAERLGVIEEDIKEIKNDISYLTDEQKGGNRNDNI